MYARMQHNTAWGKNASRVKLALTRRMCCVVYIMFVCVSQCYICTLLSGLHDAASDGPPVIGLLLAFCRNLPFHCMPTLNSTSTYEMKPRSSKWPYMHDVRLQKTCFHDVIIMVCVWWFSHWKCENRENRVKTAWKPCENRSKNCENRKFAL